MPELHEELLGEISKITLIDPHSHINPRQPASKSLDDILGYHYYTELAHSAGMDKKPLAADVKPRERVRAILGHMDRFDNTVQYQWFDEIARALLGFEGEKISADACDALCDAADRKMAQPDWEDEVLKKSNIEKVFLTNDFDDDLEGVDTKRYVPCLRTDDLVFHLDKKEVRDRLGKCTNIEVGASADLGRALLKLFDRFTRGGARACAISLPPDFQPGPVPAADLDKALQAAIKGNETCDQRRQRCAGIFWLLAEQCRQFRLPFDLMIGVNRRVYEQGVHQGQDLFDQRTSLIQYKELFNAFADVTFPISVLTSSQNQELMSYSWIFPNVVTSGHWWYSNIPVYIEHDARARLQAVPKTKQLGYYSDMYKLEFGLPKFNMYRRILAKILADDFVRGRGWKPEQALDLARLVLRDNVQRIFHV